MRGGAVHVRRIRDDRDPMLLTLPKGSEDEQVAARSFGLAVAVETGKEEYITSAYRIGWRTIDSVLPAR